MQHARLVGTAAWQCGPTQANNELGRIHPLVEVLRVFALVSEDLLHTGTSPRLCGKPVWWAPRHGGVAGSGQVRVFAAGIGPLGSEPVGLKRMQRRRGGALAPLRTSTIRPKTRGRAAGRLSRVRPVQDRAGREGGLQVV